MSPGLMVGAMNFGAAVGSSNTTPRYFITASTSCVSIVGHHVVRFQLVVKGHNLFRRDCHDFQEKGRPALETEDCLQIWVRP